MVRLLRSMGACEPVCFRMRGSWATNGRGQSAKLGQPSSLFALARKLGLTLAALALVGALVSVSTFSAFSSTAATAPSTFQSGTVVLTGSGAAQTPFAVTGLKPGDQSQRCLTISGALAPYLTNTVERGDFSATTPSDGSCGGFTTSGSAAPIWSGQAERAACGMDRRDLGPPAGVARRRHGELSHHRLHRRHRRSPGGQRHRRPDG